MAKIEVVAAVPYKGYIMVFTKDGDIFFVSTDPQHGTLVEIQWVGEITLG